MVIPNKAIIAEEVELRPFTVGYVPEVFGLIDESRGKHSRFFDETAKAYPNIQAVFNGVMASETDSRERYVIVSSAGQVVGNIKATPLQHEKEVLEIGYWVGIEHTGNGYAGMAVRGLSSVLLKRPEVVSLRAYVDPQNEASQRVLDSSGFTKFDLRQSNDDSLIYIRKQK